MREALPPLKVDARPSKGQYREARLGEGRARTPSAVLPVNERAIMNGELEKAELQFTVSVTTPLFWESAKLTAATLRRTAQHFSSILANACSVSPPIMSLPSGGGIELSMMKSIAFLADKVWPAGLWRIG